MPVNSHNSNSVMVFYTIQGELGEDQRHPNAFTISKSRRNLRQKDVIDSFPLLQTGIGQYLFRFRCPSGPKSYVYEDVVGDGSKEAPIYNGVIFLKVLRLDNIYFDLEIPNEYLNYDRYAVMDNLSGDLSASSDEEEMWREEEKNSNHRSSLDSFASVSDDAEEIKHRKNKKKKKKSRKSHSRPKSIDVHSVEEGADDMMQFSPRASSSNYSWDNSAENKPKTFEQQMADIGIGNVEDKIASRLEEIRNEDILKNNEIEEKQRIEQDILVPMKNWAKDGSEFKQIRTLLGTLHTVLWKGTKWKEVGMTDLIQPRKVKIAYFKAMRICHPDKLKQDADMKTKVIAEQIFQALNQSWKAFEAKEMS